VVWFVQSKNGNERKTGKWNAPDYIKSKERGTLDFKGPLKLWFRNIKIRKIMNQEISNQRILKAGRSGCCLIEQPCWAWANSKVAAWALRGFGEYGKKRPSINAHGSVDVMALTGVVFNVAPLKKAYPKTKFIQITECVLSMGDDMGINSLAYLITHSGFYAGNGSR
jgi:hypothetical protein